MIEISDDEEMEDELVQDGYHSFDEEIGLGQIEEEKGQEQDGRRGKVKEQSTSLAVFK